MIAAGRGSGESDPKESNPLVEDAFDRGWNAAGQGVGLAEYVYPDEEFGGVADCEVWPGAANRGGASGDRGNFGSQAVSGME